MFDFLLNTLKDISIFVGYLKNNTYPLPLEKEQEDYYISKLKDNDNNEARQKLIEHNLRLVMHIAKKYSGTKQD